MILANKQSIFNAANMLMHGRKALAISVQLAQGRQHNASR